MAHKIAYLGPKGTFTEEALRLLCTKFKENQEKSTYIPMETIPDGLLACAKGEADYAMVPIENSIEGSVNLTLDWLIHQVDLPIQAELTLPIHQYAMVHQEQSKTKLEHITAIYSHPHAIAQCHHFIRTYCPNAKIEYAKSTSEAAETIANHPQEAWLAIGAHTAAQINHLYVVKEDIEDHPNNFTRFVLVGQNDVQPLLKPNDENKYKTSILITLPEDFPGALHQVLSAFAWRKLNLSRIESRPTKKGLGSYFFFIDIEQGMDDVLLPAALAEIEALGCQVKYLGSYPCFLPKKMSKMPT